MNERTDTDVAWDEVVDVICVGTSPGVLAYAICCVAADLDVVLVGGAGEPDPQTAAWYAAMTEDLPAPTEGLPVPRLNLGGEIAVEDRHAFSLARLVPIPAPTGKRVTLEPFVGEHLRQWSADCAKSPFGVMFTQVPDLLVPMRTEDGKSVTAVAIGDFGSAKSQARDAGLEGWLLQEAAEMDLLGTENVMTAMVLEGGRVAGVHLDDGSLIAASGGLALPVGAAALHSPLPLDADDLADDLVVAIVGRPAGRFATVDLLRR
jgi:hypothetical protein